MLHLAKKAVLAVALLCAVCVLCSDQSHPAQADNARRSYELPFGHNPFAPSNASTTTGGFLRQADFIPAARCAECHKEAHAQWRESAHGNSFREPFYQANVKHLIRDRGIAATRHCESCHNPAALFSGALAEKASFPRPFDEEGVTCSACHSIESTTTVGIGSYVIAPPALLVEADGKRIATATNQEIWANVASHKRAVMRPLLKTPEFCAACHKAAVVPELNGRKWLRSFAVYDEWQQSAFSTESAQPLAKRERQTCQDCHMPQKGPIASHRWPGANTAIPNFYGFSDQLAATRELLQSGVVTIDVIADPAWRREKSPADAKSLNVDVVVANRGVGHAFPAELRDIFEAWIEIEARDSTGRRLFHSGAVSSDGSLEADAHAYRTIPIDDRGNPIVRHDIWNTRIGAFDRHIPAGRADVASYSIPVGDAGGRVTVFARVNYRRFNKTFNDWVKRDTPTVGPPPVTEMAAASVIVGESSQHGLMSQGSLAPALRWRAYGVALFDQQQYEAADWAFGRALETVGDDALKVNLLADLAMVALKAEQLEPKHLARAEESISRALALAPNHPRAQFQRALLDIKRFRYSEAAVGLEKLAIEYPRDRRVWSELSGLYLTQYRDREALDACLKLLEIEPQDVEAREMLTGLYWRLGKYDEAAREQYALAPFHADTVGETLRREFLRKNGKDFSTWPWREIGDNPIGSR